MNGRLKVICVCGPPGSGKTTYVAKRMRWGDLVVDLDTLYEAIGGGGKHQHPATHQPYALAARAAIIGTLDQDEGGVRRAWLIFGGARASERRDMRVRFGADVRVLAVPPDECLRRIAADPKRSAPAETWRPLVERWWREYQPDEEGGDNVLRPAPAEVTA